MINIVQEEIQRRDPLNETLFYQGPFLRGNHAGKRIEGKNTLRSLIVAVDGKGYPVLYKGSVDSRLLFLEIFVRIGGETPANAPVVFANGVRAASGEHFVEEFGRLVVLKYHWFYLSGSSEEHGLCHHRVNSVSSVLCGSHLRGPYAQEEVDADGRVESRVMRRNQPGTE